MAVKLESVIDDLLQLFGGAAEENNWSECFQLGVVGLVGFGYDDHDGSAELLWPYSILDEAVEECSKPFEDLIRSFGVLLWVNEVLEMSPVDVVPTRGGRGGGVSDGIV